MVSRPPDLTPGNPLLDLARGFSLPFRALSLMFATPALRRLTLAVAALTMLTLTALLWGLWQATPGVVNWLWAPPGAWYLGWLHAVFGALVFLLLLVVGASVLPLTLAAPLLDPISVEAERALGIPVEESGGVGRLLAETARALGNAVARAVVLVAGHLLLLLLLVIPGPGTAVWSWASWVWTVIWLAAQYLDVPMARHLYPFRWQAKVLRERKLLCFGFGAAVYAMLWVPLLNFFFVPVAVIAGTMLFRGVLGTGLLPAPHEVTGAVGQPAATSE